MGHSLWIRANAVVMYALLLSLAIVATGHVRERRGREVGERHPATGEIEVEGVHVLTERQRRDQALLSLKVDLRLANGFDPWSTKLLFAWLEVEYATKEHPVNKVVLWDNIIQTPDRANVSAGRLMSEYVLEDPGTNLKDAQLKLNARYDAFPWIGKVGKHHTIHDVTVVEKVPFVMPKHYTDGRGGGAQGGGGKSKRVPGR